MTINEMIANLEALRDEGFGDAIVINAEQDDVFAITECDDHVVIYF